MRRARDHDARSTGAGVDQDAFIVLIFISGQRLIPARAMTFAFERLSVASSCATVSGSFDSFADHSAKASSTPEILPFVNYAEG
jgi:hypothetical protein